MTKHTDLNTLVITSKSSHEKNQNIMLPKKRFGIMLWDKPHDEVVKNISKW